MMDVDCCVARKKNCLETTTVASGWRGDGHGTEFIKTWFEQFESDEIEIMHFGDTEPFIKQPRYSVHQLTSRTLNTNCHGRIRRDGWIHRIGEC